MANLGPGIIVRVPDLLKMVEEHLAKKQAKAQQQPKELRKGHKKAQE